MRAPVLSLVLTACGPVLLGHEPREDAGGSNASPQVSLSVASTGCDRCFELHASGLQGEAPYTFEWDDGSNAEVRRVCPGDGSDTVSVVAIDALARRSAPALTQLAFPDASCPPPPKLLCIQNPSFEGTPAFNDTNTSNFDAAPWNACPQPSLNTPDIVNETIEQPIATLPPATQGKTYIGSRRESRSRSLCASPWPAARRST